MEVVGGCRALDGLWVKGSTADEYALKRAAFNLAVDAA
jgi:hypothetical protein